MVTPDFLRRTFLVHNGKTFHSVFITENMVGHKLGEFSPTRIFKKHGAHTAKVTKSPGRPRRVSEMKSLATALLSLVLLAPCASVGQTDDRSLPVTDSESSEVSAVPA